MDLNQGLISFGIEALSGGKNGLCPMLSQKNPRKNIDMLQATGGLSIIIFFL